MANAWLRLYSEFATDQKVQMLSEADQRRLIMLFCIRCSNGDVTLHDEEVTFLLRVTADEWAKTKAIFVSKEFIDSDNNVLNWDKRQYVSDSSAARVSKHRASKKDAVTECNVTVTPPEQIQNRTDTEQISSKDMSPPTATTKPKNGTRLPDDWVLPKAWGEWAICERPDFTPDQVRKISELFKDHFIANASRAVGKKSDWQAAWRNWIRQQKVIPSLTAIKRPLKIESAADFANWKPGMAA